MNKHENITHDLKEIFNAIALITLSKKSFFRHPFR